ncbi:aminoglycoside adenylyltransferase domain-containing protein [Paenibacillus taiwanensis]|uniref:aminoglycoside adenylyltransferase domain-containing protein n=1 Tax=Paenibacillus taiwanensis TaxID=401638 RepID=UPI0003FD8CFD|nr:aminoglycoside adenylyltransferase domain-containing protein [Paenibacillus taiwanensis]
MFQDLHHSIQDILKLYMELIDEVQPGLLEGLYIYGSVAMGDYSLQLSDIDFIAITRQRMGNEHILAVEEVHRKVRRAYKKPNLNGIYITWAELGKRAEEVEPFPYYCEERMHHAGYFEMNLVTWYGLKTHGITLIGPTTDELPYEVSWQQLIQDMQHNLQTYWKSWIKRSRYVLKDRLGLYLFRSQVEWGVLGISRLYYTFKEQDITSKRLAGQYALRVVPEQWHPIIKDAIAYREGIRGSSYRSRAIRKADALSYMEYIISQCAKEESQ